MTTDTPAPLPIFQATCVCGQQSADYPVPPLDPMQAVLQLAAAGWCHDQKGLRLCPACAAAKGIPPEAAETAAAICDLFGGPL